MSEDEPEVLPDDEDALPGPLVPPRPVTAAMAVIGVLVLFLVGVLIGFVLGRTV